MAAKLDCPLCSVHMKEKRKDEFVCPCCWSRFIPFTVGRAPANRQQREKANYVAEELKRRVG